jgi:hypothetical protein
MNKKIVEFDGLGWHLRSGWFHRLAPPKFLKWLRCGMQGTTQGARHASVFAQRSAEEINPRQR